MPSGFVGRVETRTQKTISLQLNPEISVEDAQALLAVTVAQLTPIIGFQAVQNTVNAAAGIPDVAKAQG